MYKLVIGSVKVTVSDDDTERTEAVAAARKAIAAAAGRGKSVSHIEISAGPDGLQAITTERAGGKAVRKTVRQSMLDAVLAAAREKLYPTSTFASKDSWCDPDSGQEWYGEAVETARQEIMAKLDSWIKTV